MDVRDAELLGDSELGGSMQQIAFYQLFGSVTSQLFDVSDLRDVSLQAYACIASTPERYHRDTTKVLVHEDHIVLIAIENRSSMWSGDVAMH